MSDGKRLEEMDCTNPRRTFLTSVVADEKDECTAYRSTGRYSALFTVHPEKICVHVMGEILDLEKKRQRWVRCFQRVCQY